MYRLKMESNNQATAYKRYQDAQMAHLVAITIVRNKDYEKVTVENLEEKKIEKIYKNA